MSHWDKKSYAGMSRRMVVNEDRAKMVQMV